MTSSHLVRIAFVHVRRVLCAGSVAPKHQRGVDIFKHEAASAVLDNASSVQRHECLEQRRLVALTRRGRFFFALPALLNRRFDIHNHGVKILSAVIILKDGMSLSGVRKSAGCQEPVFES